MFSGGFRSRVVRGNETRGDTDDQSDIRGCDSIWRYVLIDSFIDDTRNELAELNKCLLIVECHNLRATEDFQAACLLQSSQ